MKGLQILLLILILGLIVSAQTKRRPRTKSVVPKNSILAVILPQLSTPEICGSPEWAEKEVYSGSIIKRDFDDSEMLLSGFVLRDAKDDRTYINIDTEHVSGLAASASNDLADFLTKGRRIKVWVYRCRRILYAYKIAPL
jgi:hypothetical protein